MTDSRVRRVFWPYGNCESDLLSALATHIQLIDVAAEFGAKLNRYNEIVSQCDYAAALEVFNRKGLFRQVANQFGIDAEVYERLALSMIRENVPLSQAVSTYVDH